ncbi:hypothetical protein H2136_06895 [Aeromonas hydrophila]|uniref:Uncharacterized protein n=1 Tax=Aeromonas hydrophila TaxID=644 RepID=A0A926FN88_AERHY|nr:hypothetical protein [Aeromonas hydrophila]
MQGLLVSAQTFPRGRQGLPWADHLAGLGVIARLQSFWCLFQSTAVYPIGFADLEIATQSLPVINRNSMELGKHGFPLLRSMPPII